MDLKQAQARKKSGWILNKVGTKWSQGDTKRSQGGTKWSQGGHNKVGS